MFCSKCGTQIADTAAFCSSCGQATGSQPPAQSPPQPPVQPPAPRGIPLAPSGFGPAASTVTPPAIPPPPMTTRAIYASAVPAGAMAYAGFWLRFVAWIIDIFLLDIVLGIFLFGPILGRSLASIQPGNFFDLIQTLGPKIREVQLITLGIMWLYYALMESSPWQATLGKKALGLVVSDLNGRRLTFGRATGRFFGKIVSFPFTLGIGYIMAGFTTQKQALHDMIAGCLVVRKL